MKIEFKLNGQTATFEAGANDTLYGMLRSLGISSVKCGCETTNCGLCTVHMDGKAVLSCSVPAMRCNGRDIRTLEGMGDAAKALADCLADEGADQCGFCAPGMMMNVLMLASGKRHTGKNGMPFLFSRHILTPQRLQSRIYHRDTAIMRLTDIPEKASV